MIAFGIDAIDAVRSSPHPTALNASYRVATCAAAGFQAHSPLRLAVFRPPARPFRAGPNPFPDFSMALEESPQCRRADFLSKDLFNFRQPPMGASIVVLQPLQRGKMR